MNIEFHLPYGKVNERIIIEVRRELLKLHHDEREISRAQVYFKSFGKLHPVQQCIIDLTIYGNNIRVMREANSFQLAAKKCLAYLKEKIDLDLHNKGILPDELVTTVKI